LTIERLAPTRVYRFYRGGKLIGRLRGEAEADDVLPEDWVGSVTAFPRALLPAGAPATMGISPLPDGTLLANAVAADPEGWLGPELARELGEPGLLVKLLDAGERLPVHCHPTREVARAKLGSRFGKNEGWIVIAAEPEAAIWLGFSRPVGDGELRRWIEAQDAKAMLEAMNRIEVAPRDVYYVPAGLPHSIGVGVTIVELQEPTSFSILAEYARFGLDDEQATLGLGWDVALDALDLEAHTPVLRLPEEAKEFFWADEIPEPAGRFAVLLVLEGEGKLDGQPAGAGDAFVLPASATRLELAGDLRLVRCLAPE
jgi:mannose-6-phosphate isomerase